MSRGQLTMFFLVGLVLVAVVLLLIFARSDIRSTQSEAEMTPEAEQYLKQCVDGAVHSYLDKLAAGNFGDTRRDVGSETIALGLRAWPDWPPYGYATSYIDLPDVTEDGPSLVSKLGDPNTVNWNTRFGRDVLQPLCDSQGPNKLTEPNTHCSSFAYDGSQKPGTPMQRELQNLVTSTINNCLTQNVDPSLGVDFQEFTPADAEVILGNQALIVNTAFDNGLSLEQAYNVRLLMLYEYANDQLIRTAADPRQPIKNKPNYSPWYKDGFVIESNGLRGGAWDITYTDLAPGFEYDGKPLTLRFAVDKREQGYTPNQADPVTNYDLDPDI